MAITFMDGFDLYTQSGMNASNNGKWSSSVANHPQLNTGRFGGQALDFNQNNGIDFNCGGGFSSASNLVTVGFAIRMNGSSMGDANRRIIWFQNGSTVIATLAIDVNGAIRFYRGDNSTLLLSTAAGVIASATWAYVEVQFTRDSGSSGIIEIQVNGVNVAGPLTGQNTGSAAIDTFRFMRVQSLSSSDNILIDDVYIKNDVTGFLGDVRIETIRPSADTADKDWTRSTGSDNYALVDETTNNGDTDYVSSANVGDKDIYDVTNLSSTPATIHAVQPAIVARKDDATTREVAARVKSDASVAGTTHAMASTYRMFSAPISLDPDGSIAWTAAAVNAAQLEIEVIT